MCGAVDAVMLLLITDDAADVAMLMELLEAAPVEELATVGMVLDVDVDAAALVVVVDPLDVIAVTGPVVEELLGAADEDVLAVAVVVVLLDVDVAAVVDVLVAVEFGE